MKKILSILVTLLLIFTLSGCKNSRNEQTQSSSAPTISSVESFSSGTAESSSSSSVTESSSAEITEESLPESSQENTPIDEDGNYTSKDDVALYIHTYGHLPNNFITKSEAEKLGWSGGSLEPYAAGKCIGGSRFGNYEGLLPKKSGRVYTECDIDTLGKNSRGAKRIVFSNDGLIYYTEDHYESFTLLYGEE